MLGSDKRFDLYVAAIADTYSPCIPKRRAVTPMSLIGNRENAAPTVFDEWACTLCKSEHISWAAQSLPLCWPTD